MILPKWGQSYSLVKLFELFMTTPPFCRQLIQLSKNLLPGELAGLGACTCSLKQLSAELLCQIDGKEFWTSRGGRRRASEKERKGKNQEVGKGWAVEGEVASQNVKMRKTTA